MTKRRGAIIPNPENPTGTYRRVLCIPGSPDWIALVTGALYVLTQEWYWDAQTGDIDAVVARAKQMYFEYQDQSGDCDVPVIPVGAIMQMGNAMLPPLWLYCNGDELLKASYPDLWNALGTLWGTATLGSDYFVLPDYRNKSPYGFQYGGGATKAFGSSHGAETVTLTEAEIPAHNHAAPVSGAISGSVGNTATYSGGIFVEPRLNTQNTGGGDPHNNLHPVAVCGFIIYAGV